MSGYLDRRSRNPVRLSRYRDERSRQPDDDEKKTYVGLMPVFQKWVEYNKFFKLKNIF